MKNIGVILAGGSGKRMGSDIPKQFLNLAGKTVLEHTIEKFDVHPQIDEITLVVSEQEIERTQAILKPNTYSKVKHIVPGGRERYHSSLAAIEVYKECECNLLIHDAARPMVTERIISDVISALKEFQAVNTAIPATDTIIETDASHTFIQRIPDRNLLYLVQTPQGFDRQTLAKAYEKALQDPHFITTDDCSVVRKYLPDVQIKIVKGDTRNLKLTYAEDLALLEFLIKSNMP